MSTEDYEFTLFQKNEVYVYRIAPRPPQGHRAEDWKECIWKGRLKILEKKSGECIVRLEDNSNGKLFAESRFKLNYEEAVERTVDSSRYFVLRLDDGKGRHAYVGMGFDSRNDAFDFNCALSDYTRRRQYEMDQTKNPPQESSKKSQDYKLREGEKIRVVLKGHTKPSNARVRNESSSTPSSSTTSTSPTSMGVLLPPPPPSKLRLTSTDSGSSHNTNNNNLLDDEEFDDFLSAAPPPSADSSSAPPPPAATDLNPPSTEFLI